MLTCRDWSVKYVLPGHVNQSALTFVLSISCRTPRPRQEASNTLKQPPIVPTLETETQSKEALLSGLF